MLEARKRRRPIYDFLLAHLWTALGSVIALATLIYGVYSFEVQRKQFKESMSTQAKANQLQVMQFKKSMDVQAKVNKSQAVQFKQQEKRLQRQRYTELVNILWSVDGEGKPVHNAKLRVEAVKEFLQTDWMPELKLSKSLADARLEDVNLSDMDLRAIDFREVKFSNAHLDDVNLQGADLRWSTMENVSLLTADLREVNFYKANLNGTDFLDANLQGAIFSEASLKKVNLQQVDLQGVDLLGADLKGAIGITCEQLIRASRWQNTYRDRHLACGAPIPVKEDYLYENQGR
jgi:uncharacterized protein YjbI with pentapeptide repeats